MDSIKKAAETVNEKIQQVTGQKEEVPHSYDSQGRTNFTARALFDLTGIVAAVTGGGTGIGLMISQAFAANGATVYIMGRRLDVLQTSASQHGSGLSGSLIPLVCDVSSKESISTAVQQISQKHGKLNILVNNSGVMNQDRDMTIKDPTDAESVYNTLWQEDFADWDRVFHTNVFGVYFTTIAFLPLLSKGNAEGKYLSQVITVSSIGGLLKRANSGMSYSISKAASTHIGRCMANFLVPLKIRSNIIAPGLFPSEMTTTGSDATNKSEHSELNAEMVKKIPVGRGGEEADMAQTALFLACNGFMNGGLVYPDGGALAVSPSTI